MSITIFKLFRSLLFPIFLFLAYSVSALADNSLTHLEKEILAPQLSLFDMDGVKHQLADYKGKTIIVNFWATWCPPCRAEMPSMERAWQKIKDDNIVMLAVNVGEDEETIFSFLGDYPVNFTILLDQSGHTIEKWPVKGLPTTFIISPKGEITYQAIGGREWDSDALLKRIRQLK